MSAVSISAIIDFLAPFYLRELNLIYLGWKLKKMGLKWSKLEHDFPPNRASNATDEGDECDGKTSASHHRRSPILLSLKKLSVGSRKIMRTH